MKMRLLSSDFTLKQRKKPTVSLIEPEKAALLMVQQEQEKREKEFAPPFISATEIHEKLRLLLTMAKTERMDFVIPMIEAMQMSLALDHASHNAPPGTLTVKGWIALLNNWENHLKTMRTRQIDFACEFFREISEQMAFRNTPLVPMVQELVDIMEIALKERVRQNSEEQGIAC